MSRLYDRVMAHGCEPFDAGLLLRFTDSLGADEDEAHRALVGVLGHEPTADDVIELAAARDAAQRSLRNSKSSDVFRADDLEDAVVVSAEEVADYVGTLPAGTNVTDVVSSVAPPFNRMFIEFQNRRNKDMLALYSWGVLIDGTRTDEGWQLDGALVGELKKGEPFGPILRWTMMLDQEGLLNPVDPRWAAVIDRDGLDHLADEEGYGTILVRALDLPDVPGDAAFEFANSLGWFLCAALFTLSLMHCKNVDARPVLPPERVSRKHERRHGRPLTRYYVLDVQPMRRILDSEGEAQTKGLGHALHICRGHFKTFTEDAPLFGKRVGTYWWPFHLRGSAKEGVVEKDYRIRLEGDGIGQTYREADEAVMVAPAEERADDPDTSQRGLRAHNRTQNLLAAALTEAGFSPCSPKPDEPDFDLAWLDGDMVWVAEVKSTTEKNEERQMRLAIGQVIRYRERLSGEGIQAQAMIAVENAPFDESWIDLCGREGIALVWPEVMAQALGTIG